MIFSRHEHRRRDGHDRDIRIDVETSSFGRIVDISHTSRQTILPGFRCSLSYHFEYINKGGLETMTHFVASCARSNLVDDVVNLVHIRRWTEHVFDLGREGRVHQVGEAGDRDVSIDWTKVSRQRHLRTV